MAEKFEFDTSVLGAGEPEFDLSVLGEEAAPVRPTNLRAPAVDESEDAVLARENGIDFELIKQSPAYKDGMLRAATELNADRPKNPITAAGSGFAQEAGNIVSGFVQHGLNAVKGATTPTSLAGTDLQAPQKSAFGGPTAALFEAMQKLQRGAYEKSLQPPEITGNEAVDSAEAEKAADVSKFAKGGELTADFAMPSPGGKIKAATALGTLAVRGMQGAVAAAAMPEYDRQADESGMAGRAATGGVIGAALTPVMGGLTRGGAKIANYIKKEYDPSVNTTAMDFLHKEKIPFNVGDLSEWMPGTRAMVGEVPSRDLKTMQGLQSKITEAQVAMQRDVSGTRWSDYRGIKEAAADPTNIYHTEAVALVDRLKKPSTDPNDVIKVSGELQTLRGKVLAEKLYQNADALGASVTAVKSDNYKKALDAAIAKRTATSGLGTSTNADPLLRKLIDLRTANDAASVVDFATARQLRKKLGELPELQKEKGLVDALRTARRVDMVAAANAAKKPSATNALDKADQFYAKAVEERGAKFAKELEKGTVADRLYNQMVKTGQGTQDAAQVFYNGLDKKGQAAVRAEMMNRAVVAATNDVGEIIPQQVGVKLQELQRANNVFFKGPDKFELNGLLNVLKHMESAKPPSGAGAVKAAEQAGRGAGMTATSGGSAVGGLSAAAGLLGMKKAMNSFINGGPERQKFWIAASDLKPGTPAMDKLIQQIDAVKSASVVGISRYATR